MRGSGVLAGFALAGLVTGPALSQTAPGPLRHLVYSFNYGATRNLTAHNSGFNDGAGGSIGNGIDSYTDRASTTGTIIVDVIREQPDKGLVLDVSETGNNPARNAKPATCVVYGSGNIICDPSATVNPEEYTVVRLLGENFVDPALIDAQHHWRFSSSGPQYEASSDYTIVKNDGGIMQINETRKVTYVGSRAGSAEVTNTIGYDFTRQIPLWIDEVTTDHPQASEAEIDNRVTVSAKLQSDSMAAAATH
jgi:hypothetical protein